MLKVGGTGFNSQPTAVEAIEVNVDSIALVNVYCTLYSTSAYWLLANIVKIKTVLYRKVKGCGTMLSSQQTVVETIEVNYKVNFDIIGLVNWFWQFDFVH